ncbi:hypothetical protein QTA56_03140 [Acinetobacter sp. VNH17]|uniref:Secreted protein n=1 Tax=Acinetobacter thutiue TaxID=2998078 RepID=A0ABT7WKZ3_9GAMM|nr:hypothetical protein [Acinetobacter thutiue]MCY6411132.1 hypothetical protein [Acinetobacter thutiue]MDN0013234.1 hypothetical protein [Acinetobacter thutiue]
MSLLNSSLFVQLTVACVAVVADISGIRICKTKAEFIHTPWLAFAWRVIEIKTWKCFGKLNNVQLAPEQIKKRATLLSKLATLELKFLSRLTITLFVDKKDIAISHTERILLC